MATVSEFFAVIVPEVGYTEKRSNAQLDSPTANAGSGNWTKYARDLDEIPGFYNTPKNGYPWCAVFPDWGRVKAFGVEKAKAMVNHTTCGAGCVYAAQAYRNAGRWYSSPKAGDQIFFGPRGDEYHTGVVEHVDSKYVYTIEGNTSPAEGVVDNGGMVCRKRYRLNYYEITGYGRPAYDNETGAAPETNTNTNTDKGDDTVEITLKMLSKGSTGEQVRNLQRLLIAQGYSCGPDGADGDFGGNTDAAVRTFQRAENLEVDGIVGHDTWTALLT